MGCRNLARCRCGAGAETGRAANGRAGDLGGAETSRYRGEGETRRGAGRSSDTDKEAETGRDAEVKPGQ